MSYKYGLLGLSQFLFLRIFLHKERRFTLLTVVLCTQISFSNASLAANAANDFYNKITVTEKDGVYSINASSDISASNEHVRQVLTDYVHIYRLNDSIIESRILTPTDSGKVQVETLVQCCVPMYCKDVVRVEEVSELESGIIQTTIVAEKSDFRSGIATWKIEPKGNITHLTYEAHLEPDFFIPPLIGTQLVINSMRKEFSTTFYRIERIAAINEAREWDGDFQFKSAKKQKKIKPCATISSAEF